MSFCLKMIIIDIMFGFGSYLLVGINLSLSRSLDVAVGGFGTQNFCEIGAGERKVKV